MSSPRPRQAHGSAGASPSREGDQTFAVVTPPGVEALTRAEIEALGVTVAQVEPGLLTCRGDAETLFKLNLHLRTATRVLVRMGEFGAAAFSELHKKAARLPWARHLVPGRELIVRVTSHGSKLYHKKGIAERIVVAVSEAVGGPVKLISAATAEDESDAPLILVRLAHNLCTISLDSSGASLHRRGYRLAVAKAPLRENLAAALVLASGWDRRSPLVDPFCGSGAIPIEAAMMAAGLPPGGQRSFAFQGWPTHEAAVWQAIKAAVITPSACDVPVLYGYDRDTGAVRSAEANAERAGVAGRITWARQSISDLQLPETLGWIVTNPPYGARLKGGPDLRNLYARFGDILRERAAGWHTHLVSASLRWLGQMQVTHQTLVRFNNGGIPVNFVQVSEQETKASS